MLRDILDKKKCFKLVCGALNQDCDNVKKLVALYSCAGCKFFDLSADEKVILAAKEGLKISGKDGYLCVSVGIKGDPHINKAFIKDNCIKCQKCEDICPQNAIKNSKIEQKKCIGCALCVSNCPNNAIELKPVDLSEILPSLIKKGIDCIELHIASYDKKEIFKKWDKINDLFNGILSISLDRNNFSDKETIEILNKLLLKREPYTTIVQSDGVAMSGRCDDYKTTLQTVALADMIQNQGFKAYIMLSGGTNSKTSALAKMCGIEYGGIAFGSFARKIVKEYIERDDFFENKKIFNEALKIAKKLVETV